MSFIKVLTDVDGEVSSLPARVINTNSDGSFTIQYLSKTEKKHTNGKSIYEYEVETYNITEESINEYMYDETECGFKLISSAEIGEFIKDHGNHDEDEDGDYIPSSDNDETEESDDDEDSEDDEMEDEEIEDEDLDD